MAYEFDPAALEALVREHLEGSVETRLDGIVDGLAEAHPGKIDLVDEWFFSNAGGIMGTCRLLYASLSEYLLLFGTPNASEGHSGRHRADLWDIVIDGELRTYQEHDKTAKVWSPGQTSALTRGDANCSKLANGTWLLEYARGPIPTMLPFGLMDAFMSTLDGRGIAQTFKVYTRCTLRALKP